MPAQLNHTLVHCRDSLASATFLAEMLELPAPDAYGPFQCVDASNSVSLDFMEVGDSEIVPQHYAFLVAEEEFDRILGRLEARGLDHFADPHGHQKGQINHEDGGRGLYWSDPDGHWLEIITVPYGGWR
jgi:extradiol dioxygenase family protein